MKEQRNRKNIHFDFLHKNTEKISTGIIHFADKNRVIKSYNGKLYQSYNAGKSWKFLIDLTSGYKEKMLVQSKLLSRLYRMRVYHVVPAKDVWVIFGFKKIFFLTHDLKKIVSQNDLLGSKPLNVCYNEKGVFYGEYLNNKERKPVKVWSYSNKLKNWQQVWQFSNIRHIHGLHNDPFNGSVWITTGDKNEESFIKRTQNNFQTIEIITGGTQQQRAIKLLFTREFVYFGSDTPHEKNYLYRLNRKNKNINKLVEVGGSIFHGWKVNNWLFFSTAVEPSKINTSKYSEVWASPNGTEWKCILRLKKDCWNKKYFQYGQVLFPEGPGDGKNLWFTPFSTEYDQRVLKISLQDIKKKFFNLSEKK